MSLPKNVAAAIDKARAAYIESTRKAVRPGPEWFTAKECAEHEGVKPKTACERLRKMRKAGVVESKVVGVATFWRVRP